MPAHKSILPLMAVLWSLSFACCQAENDDSTPLEIAVSTFNKELAEYPFDNEMDRARALTDLEPPRPLTADEVVTAIAEWDRTKYPVEESIYSIFRQISESKMLPPRSDLSLWTYWQRSKDDERTEDRMLRIDLSVMTGATTGYTFPIRTHKLYARRYLELSPGYEWIVGPHSIKPCNRTMGGVVYTILKDDKDALQVIASTLLKGNPKDVRGVMFDAEGNRHEPTSHLIGRHNDMVMLRIELGYQAPHADSIELFGIERLTEGGIVQQSRSAMREAKNKGLDVLPLPIVNEKLNFELTAFDGGTIDSEKLRGKVVVIDCFASWCGPCVRQLPQLAQLYEQYHAAGLEIIGLSVDEHPAAAAKVYDDRDINWPLVAIPDDKDARRLWEDSARILTVPRVLIVDQSGVLRYDDAELPTDLVISLLDEQ